MMSSSTKVSVVGVVHRRVRSEGPRWAFRGWTLSFVRLGPLTIATLVLLDQHTRLYSLFAASR